MSDQTATSTPQAANPQKKTGKMHVNDALHVVVRLTQSKGLEGAFRVQVLPESLQQAGLTTGDLCEISNEEGTTGYGIAWRADDKINRPKNRPAKITEIFQSAFGFEEGSKVTISRTTSQIHRADRIVLSDVSPQEYISSNEADDGLWQARVIGLFAACEGIAPGITFDVTKRKSKKRFFVESVEAANAPNDSLFRYEDQTTLVFRDSALDGNANGLATHATDEPTNGVRDRGIANFPSLRTIDVRSRLNMDRIGGLLEQCQKLNSQLRRVLSNHQALTRYASRCPNPAVLLHGYGGTGKTMLLERLAECGFKKVVRLNRSVLNGGSVAKNQAVIENSFQEAIDSQPSLIIIDNLEKLAPAEDIAYATVLATNMRRVQDSRVMIAGATRALSSVEASLFDDDCFSRLIELHIPDLRAREQILNVLQHKPAFAQDSLSTRIAARTHGFTGRDLARLRKTAAIYAADRFDVEEEEMAVARSPTPPAYTNVVSPNDNSPPNARNGDEGDVLLCDFEIALQEVKPTALREIFTEKPKTSWTDIGGSRKVKESFDKVIGWPLQQKELLAKFQYQPPKGALLYGPPGCSKTLTAQAVANMYNFNFIAVKGAELVSMYVGESERAIREVFRKARTAAPCVIFFDEIDAIGSDRDSGTRGLNVLTTLLNEMDGFESLRDVFILAATNKPETLDPALMRPGRFDSHVYLGPPNELARMEILNIATRNVALASDISFDTLVADTAGYSGAEMVRICQSAKEPAIERAMRGEDARVTAADFEGVLAVTRRGITQEMLDAYEAFSAKKDA
ncbi:ATPase family protein [Fulvia fulva]|uniref:ATPase family protein n=1 Tax=Passalora fulva TaxID=5499 RepID=A0A9Q8PBY3_PASFU|nr:ATPase family protein [Fulvia fulva]UJO19671.1 ATPase family protein [Fulvia fulva]